MIQNFAAEHSVQDLCAALEVSRSGYYRWRRRRPSRREQANQRLRLEIKTAFARSRQTYGSPRITRELRRQKMTCSENRVARLMRRDGIKAKQKRPFRPCTTRTDPATASAPNRLRQQSPPRHPNQAWVADITYIWTSAGWVYLAAVMDLCSRRILGWSISQSLETTLVKEALKQALAWRRPASGLLHHSDRGVQYASSAFRALLQTYHILPSMSAQGNCYDNAAMEAFWSTLKGELIQGRTFENLADARLAIFDYIEAFYNRQRLHSALDYRSPVEFEQQWSYNE